MPGWKCHKQGHIVILLERREKTKQKWQAIAADDTESTPKRRRSEEVSDEDAADRVMEAAMGLLKSINDRLAKINVLEVIMKDLIN